LIESWQESNQSQVKFCKGNKLSISTFQYWLKKYKESRSEIKTQKKANEQRKDESFLTLKVAGMEHQLPDLPAAGAVFSDHLNIYYPNGVRLSCPTTTKPELLRNLINL
jgi:hypothetical protein